MKASQVEIKKINGIYDYYIDGVKFMVKGVGLDSTQGDNYASMVEADANTFRTWRSDNATIELENAKKYGLMVAIGIELGQELHGFDYEDNVAVKRQFERVKQQIMTYKDHPNVLCWVVGNELNLLFDENEKLKSVNPKVWSALSDIVDFIHHVDSHHPVTTTFAGFYPKEIQTMLKYCSGLDFFSVQIYGELGHLHEKIKNAGINIPYMVTEYGPTGHWEMPSTVWGREIEEPSGPKARAMMERIHKFFDTDKSGLLLGGFLFFWGQKQERTPTWYGVFNKTGEATARVDEITKYWTGIYPNNRAPLTESISIDGIHAVDSLYLKPETLHMAEVEFTIPYGDKVDTKWIIMEEVEKRSHGGAYEIEPDEVAVHIQSQNNNQFIFRTPAKKGDYRLFAYVYNGKGKVGNANFPFRIE